MVASRFPVAKDISNSDEDGDEWESKDVDQKVGEFLEEASVVCLSGHFCGD